MDALEEIALESYDRMIGLELSDVSVNRWILKLLAEATNRHKPGRQGKAGIKRSTMVDANGIPLAVVAAGANRHDWPLLCPTLDAAEARRRSSCPSMPAPTSIGLRLRKSASF